MAFQYRPLDGDRFKIRLLSLLPGVAATKVKCELRDAFLDDKPKYEALSYTWEDGGNSDKEKAKIYLEGSPFQVGNNLMAALEHLRLEDRKRLLWVDQICINQANDIDSLKERNGQMKRMGDIYRSAERVICWLGVEASDSDYAMDMIKYVTEKNTIKDTWRLISSISVLLGTFVALRPVYRGVPWRKSRGFGDREWDAIHSILERGYWRRTWIIQEQTVALQDPIVLCGSRSLPLSTFTKFQLAAGRTGRPSHIFMGFTDCHVERLKIREEYKEKGFVDLENLLIRSSIFEATEPRDKIFALQSLVHQNHKPFLEANGPDPSCEEVCRILTLHIVKAGSSLRILSRVLYPLEPHFDKYKNKEKRSEGYTTCTTPSWVPDLDRTHLDGQAWLWRGSPEEYRASGGTRPMIQHDPALDNVLTIRGFLIGQIVDVATTGLRPITDLNAAPEMARIAATALQKGAKYQQECSKAYKTGPKLLAECILKGAREALKAGELPEVFQGPVDEAMLRRFFVLEDALVVTKFARKFHTMTGIHLKPLEVHPQELFKIVSTHVKMVMNSVLCKRCFFATENGYVGFGPWGARPGDGVCIFYGGEACYVIRGAGREHPGKQYFMGDAYVHGLMQGEAFHLRDSAEARHKERDFNLI